MASSRGVKARGPHLRGCGPLCGSGWVGQGSLMGLTESQLRAVAAVLTSLMAAGVRELQLVDVVVEWGASLPDAVADEAVQLVAAGLSGRLTVDVCDALTAALHRPPG